MDVGCIRGDMTLAKIQVVIGVDVCGVFVGLGLQVGLEVWRHEYAWLFVYVMAQFLFIVIKIVLFMLMVKLPRTRWQSGDHLG